MDRQGKQHDKTTEKARGLVDPPVAHLHFTGFDGTRLAYQKVGRGPPIVLANGLGGTFAAWKHLYRRLAHRWTVLCWDYRGLYGSEPPPDLNTLSVEQQCLDLECLLETEAVQEAVFIGWSMGTQVNLEFYRNHADRFRGMVLLNGTYGHPFDTAFGVELLKNVIPKLIRLMEMGAPLVSLAARHAGRADWLIPVLQTAGLVGRTLDMEIFRELAAQFAMLDFRVYSRTLEALGRHDASDVLPTVQVPCLMITGDRDLMTPLRTAHEIERTIPDCRLRVLAGASHYAAVEFPREVGDWIVSFLETIGYPGGAVT